MLQTQIQLVNFKVDLDGPGGEEACHSWFRIGGITGPRLGESVNVQFVSLLQYFLLEICIIVTRMYHIIGNQCDSQFLQVKIRHELHRRPQVIFQRHHVMHNMDKWFTVVFFDPTR